MQQNRLFIIILTYNGQNYIGPCLDSIYKNSGDFKVLVVDNNSSDETKKIIKEKYPQALLIENSKNTGFAAGNNIGIKKALDLGAEYLVLLNQDTEVADNFVGESVAYMDRNFDVGIASPTVLYPEDEKIWFVKTKIYRGRDILRVPKTRLGEHIDKKKVISDKDRMVFDVDWVSFCSAIFRRDVFDKIGYLDESFFMYGEDVEFCMRAKMADFNLRHFPGTFVIHKEPLQFKHKITPRFVFLAFKKFFWRRIARFKIIHRYFTPREKLYYYIKFIFLPILKLAYVFKK